MDIDGGFFEMKLLHSESSATVTEIFPWGTGVRLENGEDAFLDNTKNPSWLDSENPLRVGDSLHVVILDDERSPIRVSALLSDFAIARKLRTHETK